MKPSKLSKAFTLVEIIVAVAIMSIITGVVLVGVNVNKNRQTLTTGAETVKAALQQVQTYAKNPRSQDFRPLYYVIRFERRAEAEGNILYILTRVYPDINNDGVWEEADFENISEKRLTPVIPKNATVFVQGVGEINVPPMQALPFEIGYLIGNPAQIVLILPDGTVPGLPRPTPPGLILNSDIGFDFRDPENLGLAEAYAALPGRSYPHLIISNGGAKIEIKMQDF